MSIEISFDSWLEHLRCLLPVTGMLHIGAGAGSAKAQYDDWGVPNVIFVEADGAREDTLAAMTQGREGWVAHRALMSDSEAEVDFFIYPDPHGSSLLPPESLAGGASLKPLETRRLRTTTVENLLSDLEHPSQLFNWATIDCLPALPIIKGAGNRFKDWDVIIARVLFDRESLPENGATKQEVDAFLTSSGYLCVATREDEGQPEEGHALYVRHWQDSNRTHRAGLQKRSVDQAAEYAKSIAGLQESLRSQAALAAQSREEVALLSKARDDQAKQVRDLQSQLDQLTRARDEQAKLAAERQQEIEDLTTARDDLVKPPAEGQLQLEKLTRDLDEQVKLAAERQVLFEKAKRGREEQATLALERQEQLESLERARSDQEKLAADRLTTVEQLRAELQQARQSANLATKLQMLRESDLEDLQRQYREAVEGQKRQHRLLGELEGKLRVAAQYFSQIREQQGPPSSREGAEAPKSRGPSRGSAQKEEKI